MNSPQFIPEAFQISNQQLPKIVCYQHAGQIYSTICRISTCLQPLCPQCVTTHQKEHKHSIISLVDSISEVYEYLANQANRIATKTENFNIIIQIKNELQDTINSFFNEIIQQMGELQMLPNQLQKDWNGILNRIDNLVDTKNVIKELQHTYRQGSRQVEEDEYSIQVSKDLIPQLNNLLKGLILVVKTPPPRMKTEIQIPLSRDPYMQPPQKKRSNVKSSVIIQQNQLYKPLSIERLTVPNNYGGDFSFDDIGTNVSAPGSNRSFLLNDRMSNTSLFKEDQGQKYKSDAYSEYGSIFNKTHSRHHQKNSGYQSKTPTHNSRPSLSVVSRINNQRKF